MYIFYFLTFLNIEMEWEVERLPRGRDGPIQIIYWYINAMVADDLASLWARESREMVLTKLSQNVSASEVRTRRVQSKNQGDH